MIDFSVGLARGDFRLDASARLPAQGITTVIGRSGSGKSSLLHALAGLLRPARGHVRLLDRTLFDSAGRVDLPPHERRLGVVFQEGRLFPHLSVRRNLEYGARRALGRDGPAFDDVVALLGVGPLLERRPHTLSGGERQRVAIGRALLARPAALLLDEPLASLDPARRQELMSYLAGLPRRFGLPLIHVTHQMDEVLRLADQLIVMDDGRCAAAGPALELMSDFSLHPLLGRFEAGSVLAGRVVEHWAQWQLTRVQVAGGPVTVPQIDAPVGAAVRLRLRARDITLQPHAVETSANNQLAAVVLSVLDREGPYAAVEVGLGGSRAAGERLWALVTRRSVSTLGLRAGHPVVAAFKAVAVESRYAALRDTP
jgi:molybdate transport system ATP-binding protein